MVELELRLVLEEGRDLSPEPELMMGFEGNVGEGVVVGELQPINVEDVSGGRLHHVDANVEEAPPRGGGALAFEFSGCVECGAAACARPVQEPCGHVKCRRCYLTTGEEEEEGCRQCRRNNSVTAEESLEEDPSPEAEQQENVEEAPPPMVAAPRRRRLNSAHIIRESGHREKYLCTKCGARFSTECKRKYHVYCNYRDNGFRPYRCTLCPESFVTKRNYENHFRRKHTPKAQKREKLNLRTPKCRTRSSSGGGAFNCPTCGQDFTLAKDLRRHQIIHTKEKPFRCFGFGGCNYSGCRKDNLERHFRIMHRVSNEESREMGVEAVNRYVAENPDSQILDYVRGKVKGETARTRRS